MTLKENFETQKLAPNTINNWLEIKDNIEKTKNEILKHSDYILKQNEVNDPKIKNKILLIKKYSYKHKDIFWDYIRQFPELYIQSWNIIRLKHNIEKYINDFLDILKNKLNIWLKYEKILDKKWEIEFHEALLRIEWIKNFNHIDYLNIHNDFWKSIYIFYNVLNKLFYDISKKEITWKVSVNVEISDMKNEKFIKIIKHLQEKYNIDFSKQKIIFEILENEKIPNTPEFKNKIKKLKDMWFEIALDDNIWEKVTLKDTIENIDFMWRDMDILKLDWKTIQSFYSVYKTTKDLFSDWFSKLKNILTKAKNNWTKIVAEWIEDLGMYNFAKNILWVTSFQWFFSEKEENIRILKNN